MEISRKEIARYLGYKNKKPDDSIEKMIDECLEEIENAIQFKIYSRIFDIDVFDDKIAFNNIIFKSKKLAGHLYGCKKAIVFGATLGTGIDLLLQKLSKTNMAKCAVMQACAAEVLESKCDDFQNSIALNQKQSGLYLRPRFSPGYGDFSLNYQTIFLKLLDSERRLGITVTDSLMMLPTKSVTAIIGLTTDNTKCVTEKCMLCTKTDCPFRKEN